VVIRFQDNVLILAFSTKMRQFVPLNKTNGNLALGSLLNDLHPQPSIGQGGRWTCQAIIRCPFPPSPVTIIWFWPSFRICHVASSFSFFALWGCLLRLFTISLFSNALHLMQHAARIRDAPLSVIFWR
jgi:hypothetical protein